MPSNASTPPPSDRERSGGPTGDRDTGERTRLLELQAAVGVAIAGNETLAGCLHACAEAFVRHLGAAFARIWTLSEIEPVLELQASAGLYTHLDGPHSRVPVGQFKIGLIAAERRPHLTNQVVGDPRVGNQEWAKREGMVAFAGYPLLVGEKLVGVVALFARHALTGETLRATAAIATNLAQTIERARAQERLRVSEEWLSTTLKSIGDGVIATDAAGRVAFINPVAAHLTGWSPGEAKGKPLDTVFDIVHEGTRARVESPVTKVLRDGNVVGLANHTLLLRRGGAETPIDNSAAPIRSSLGEIVGVVLVFSDASGKRPVNDLNAQILDAIADMVVVKGPHSRMVWANRAFRAFHGMTREELKALIDAPTREPDGARDTVKDDARVFESGEVLKIPEEAITGHDGQVALFNTVKSPVRDADGHVVMTVGVSRDITAEKELRKRLELGDRLASVGTLAAGVAHEVNNPLSYVMANLDLVVEEIRALSGGSPLGRMKDVEAMVREARDGAEQVRKIVQGLRALSRAEDERRALMDLEPALELAIKMTSNEIRHRARLVKDYGPVPQVHADDARLGQVFLNLLINAAQSIAAGNADGNEIRVVTSTDDRGRAVVEVRDTGAGIPEDVRARVFEPFFTTKSMGLGTGLGLSICHGIVTGMDGEISVDSTVGRGTTFRVVLPAAGVQRVPTPLPPSEDASTGAGTQAAPRTGVILVVDDEPAVGVVLRRILRDHDVTVVGTVAEALDRLASGKRFDVIFSDIMMPQKTGMDFYHEVTRRWPDDAGRIVFVTGGAFAPAASEFLEHVGNERIAKPFTPKMVRDVVQRYLDVGRAGSSRIP